MSTPQLVWQHTTVQRTQRELAQGHAGGILWFTGLSGAGKSTLANAVEARLHALGVRTYVLDGDNVRHGLCGDLGFSPKDRMENIRRVGEVASLFVDAGCVVLTAFISPFCSDRERVRALVDEGDFLEIYCQCDLAVCEQRDVKGLYQKARAGEVKEFTGISSPYEAPLAAELVVHTGHDTLEHCVQQVMALLAKRGRITLAADPLAGVASQS